MKNNVKRIRGKKMRRKIQKETKRKTADGVEEKDQENVRIRRKKTDVKCALLGDYAQR